MPRNGTVTGVIRNFGPSPDHLALADGPRPTVMTIEFDDEQPATLDPALPRADLYATAMTALQDTHWPSYFGVTGDRGIQWMKVPSIGRVSRMGRQAGGPLELEFDSIGRRLHLAPDDPDAPRLLSHVDASFKNGTQLIVVADADGLIQDLEPASPRASESFGLTFEALQEAEAEVLQHVSVVDQDQVDRIFQEFRQTECRIPPDDTCLPSNFPEEGCESRAHLICRELQRQEITAGKAWVYDTACVRHCNFKPACMSFTFHVAPFLRLKDSDELRVIDTAFLDGAVSDTFWCRRLGVHERFVSRAEAFLRNSRGSVVPERRGSTEVRLKIAREQLRLSDPPPPHRQCS